MTGDFSESAHRAGEEQTRMSLPSIMVADFHSFISKGPEMKAGGVGRRGAQNKPPATTEMQED